MELQKNEMTMITGGGLTSAMLNAISKAVNTVYDLGKQLGSSIRRMVTNQYCPVR